MMYMDTSATIPMAGFDDPVQGSQRVFRSVLDAMSHPGKIITIDDLDDAPAPLSKATAAICLSLVDFETPLWADSEIASNGEAMNYLRFHCGCPVTVDPMVARTGLISDANALSSFDCFNPGTDERPELSTTLIVQVADLSDEGSLSLSGPGIQSTRTLCVEGLAPAFWTAMRANNALFPRGIDLILSAGENIVCLPRTTKVEG